MTLSAIQSRIQSLISALPLLAGKPVLVEDKGNLAADVEQALAAMALCIVVAPSAGQAKSNQLRGRAASDEDFEIVIHRGMGDDPNSVTTVAVLQAIVPLLHGAPVDPDAPGSTSFAFKRHEMRENADGTFARVIIFSLAHTWPSPPTSSS